MKARRSNVTHPKTNQPQRREGRREPGEQGLSTYSASRGEAENLSCFEALTNGGAVLRGGESRAGARPGLAAHCAPQAALPSQGVYRTFKSDCNLNSRRVSGAIFRCCSPVAETIAPAPAPAAVPMS